VLHAGARGGAGGSGGGGPYLPLTGGTLTGTLTLHTSLPLVVPGAAGTSRSISYRTGSSPRWNIGMDNVAETGSGNTGSNFFISGTSDAGFPTGTWLTINRNDGTTTIAGPAVLSGGGTFTGAFAGVHSYTGALTFNGAPNTFNGSVALAGGGSINGTWGGNPTFAGNPIFSGLSVNVGINTAVTPLIINGPVATNRILRFTTAGVPRMQITCNTNPEGGSNGGSDFALVTFDDSGNVLGTALAIFRANSAAVFGSSVQAATIFKVGANQVVTARVTGWGVATGASRVGFAGATATLAQTSAAVAALIADLTTHGLIGP
jgi:hypothetical protein